MEFCKEYIVYAFGLIILEVAYRTHTQDKKISAVMVEHETFFLLALWFSLKIELQSGASVKLGYFVLVVMVHFWLKESLRWNSWETQKAKH